MVDITNVVNVSVSQAPRGLRPYNVNDVMFISNETPIKTVTGYSIYVSARDVATDWGTESETYKQALALFSQTPNILAGNGSLLISPMVKVGEVLETPVEALNRVSSLVYFGGFLFVGALTDEQALAVSDAVQTMDTIFMLSSNTVDSLTESTGLFAKIADKNNYKTKCLLYTQTGTKEALSAYMGRAFSVNFSAQNSTITMNLKDLNGVLPDNTITQTIYNRCQVLGVDLYTSYNGLPKVVSNGNPWFFDDFYNQLWFIQTVKVTVFNTLAQTSTKIPQTESGMNILKNSIKAVCDLAIYNRFSAPGRWTSPDTFGNQEDFLRNILDIGYYIYSLPITEQLKAEREQRKAPPIQVAIKQAGAIHSANLILSFNA